MLLITHAQLKAAEQITLVGSEEQKISEIHQNNTTTEQETLVCNQNIDLLIAAYLKKKEYKFALVLCRKIWLAHILNLEMDGNFLVSDKMLMYKHLTFVILHKNNDYNSALTHFKELKSLFKSNHSFASWHSTALGILDSHCFYCTELSKKILDETNLNALELNTNKFCNLNLCKVL